MAEEQALVQLMDTLDGLELTKSEYDLEYNKDGRVVSFAPCK